MGVVEYLADPELIVCHFTSSLSKVYSFATTGVFVLAARTTQNNSKTSSVLDLLIADPLPELGKSGDAPWAELIGPRQNCPRCPIPRGVDCSYSRGKLKPQCPDSNQKAPRRGASVRAVVQMQAKNWKGVVATPSLA